MPFDICAVEPDVLDHPPTCLDHGLGERPLVRRIDPEDMSDVPSADNGSVWTPVHARQMQVRDGEHAVGDGLRQKRLRPGVIRRKINSGPHRTKRRRHDTPLLVTLLESATAECTKIAVSRAVNVDIRPDGEETTFGCHNDGFDMSLVRNDIHYVREKRELRPRGNEQPIVDALQLFEVKHRPRAFQRKRLRHPLSNLPSDSADYDAPAVGECRQSRHIGSCRGSAKGTRRLGKKDAGTASRSRQGGGDARRTASGDEHIRLAHQRQRLAIDRRGMFASSRARAHTRESRCRRDDKLSSTYHFRSFPVLLFVALD